MPIPAHFEDLSGDALRTRATRRQLLLEAAALTPHGKATQVLIHNVSTTGLLIETLAPLRESERFDVALPYTGPTAAFVVWNSANLYGCRFAEPLTSAVLDALQQRSQTAATSEPPGEVAPQPGPGPAQQLETLPVRIARLRKQQGLTLDSLAELLGVSKPTVWAWEQGKARPTDARLAALAATLGVKEAALRTGRDSDALGQAIDNARKQVAAAFGVDPAKVKVIVEM